MSAYDELVRKPGDLSVIGGKVCRFIEAELEGDKWEVLSDEEAADAIRALEGERDAAERNLRTVQNAAKTLHNARNTELSHLRENHAFDHRLREEHQSLMDRDAMMTDLLEASEAARQSAEAKLEAVRAFLCRISAKNNLEGVPDEDVEAFARTALYECELIAGEALASLDKEKA